MIPEQLREDPSKVVRYAVVWVTGSMTVQSWKKRKGEQQQDIREWQTPRDTDCIYRFMLLYLYYVALF